MSTNNFSYDVFLSHSSKDKEVARDIATRLKENGLKVWFDEWELRPDDYVLAKVEEGLENSRVLVLCMSENAFGPDWAGLEAGTFRFRDPLNQGRRFLPIRLDDAEIKPSLVPILFVDWRGPDRAKQLERLVEACRVTRVGDHLDPMLEKAIYHGTGAYSAVFNADGNQAILSRFNTLELWDLTSERCAHVLKGHSDEIFSVALSHKGQQALSGSFDKTMRLWDIESGRCLQVFKGHSSSVFNVAFNTKDQLALSSSDDNTIRLWDLESGRCLRIFEGHSNSVFSVAFSPQSDTVLSGSGDNTIRLWDLESGRSLRVLEGHSAWVRSVAFDSQGRALSGSQDRTMRLWDLNSGRCLRIFEGHSDEIRCVALDLSCRRALSGSADTTVRLWDLDSGHCLRVFNTDSSYVLSVAFNHFGKRAFSANAAGQIQIWDLSALFQQPPRISSTDPQVQYTNAKVLLVGESGAGKTGLSKRLALNSWEPSDSTVGAWATQWKLPVTPEGDVEREIWLWDFGGQADQRLIHQLYMKDTAAAVLVFDGQKEDLFETLGQWDRDLGRTSPKTFAKLLAAGRVDAGGLRVSRSQVETFAKERGFSSFLETSAKYDVGCLALREAILASIDWQSLPWRSSPLIFRRLKEEIVRLKDEDRVLLRFNELRDALRLRLAAEVLAFKDAELKAVVGLLAGPGVVWEFTFGSWILLQPERINAYAQSVIQTLRSDEEECGCISEEKVLLGDLIYHSSLSRLPAEEERFVLFAMHQTLVERGLCIREFTEQGPLLIFPSYHRRERPEIKGHPAVLVTYRFNGFLDEIYATLVVRLHHSSPFLRDKLWRYAADFRTLTGKTLGVKLTRCPDGTGELEVYFDSSIPMEEKIIFSRYVHDYLLKKDPSLVRLRHYVCPLCQRPLVDREAAKERLEEWLYARPAGNGWRRWLGLDKRPTVFCTKCAGPVPVWDDMEQCFASPETQQRVRELLRESATVLDNESKERALVGEVISTVALAGQFSRELTVSDHGIDMEIEFKNDDGEATARKLYLQLKSGDSYLRERKKDGAEIFTIQNDRHARYWMDQAFHVLLVIRNSEGEVRWMEVRDWLRHESDNGRIPVKQILFEGERFDVMSVRRWRDRVLAEP